MKDKSTNHKKNTKNSKLPFLLILLAFIILSSTITIFYLFQINENDQMKKESIKINKSLERIDQTIQNIDEDFNDAQTDLNL